MKFCDSFFVFLFSALCLQTPLNSTQNVAFFFSESPVSEDITHISMSQTINLAKGNMSIKMRKFDTTASNEVLINFNYNSSETQKTIAGNWATTLLNNRALYSGKTRKTTSKQDDNTVIVSNDKGK